MSDTDPSQAEPDRNDFVRLFSRNAKSLYGYIASLVLNVADTDEIFQETSCILWSKFSSYDSSRDFLPWARGIAYFEVCAYRRKTKRNLLLTNEVVEAIAGDTHPSAAEANERELALSHCLEKLTEKDSNLIQLRYYEQLSTKEISRKLGSSIYSVYRALTRVHNSLLCCMERQLSAFR